MKKFLMLLLVPLIVAAGCGAGEAAPPAAEVQFEEESENYMLKDGVTPALQYSCKMPVVKIPGYKEAEDAINASLAKAKADFLVYNYDGTTENRIEAMIAMAEEEFAMRREMNEEYAFPGLYLQEDVVLARNSAPVLSFIYSDYDYTGGAHGLGGEFGVNYDMRTGALLTLADIAQDEEALKDFCADAVLQQTRTDEYRFDDGYSLFFEGYEESIPEIIDEGSWYMNDDGLTFIANPYLIAPYAAGILEFSVPYEELTALMKAEFLP